MKTEHTPGPWHKEGTTIVAGEGEDAKAIALCSMDWTSCLGGEPEANASLIAAGPDMLAALKTVLLSIEWEYQNERLSARAQADILRSAIAKAEGEGSC